ncbi:MAG TPA: tetratricopeptide repeat protein [Actinomycetota bacterium]|nr:tetratricopeptide repeat protein [Actinomycetota bacterium]HNL52642.1 tetratricopeptide repeat protein [Actinomycetota bacterium]
MKGQTRGREAEHEPRDTSNDLPWPEEIFELELEPDLMSELESFGGRTSTLAKHMLSVQVLAESDPEMSYQHAARIRGRIPRSALARQTLCICAYRTSRFKEAVKEEAAYRRISGNFDLVPIAADSERGLNRPQRALEFGAEFEGEDLDSDTRTELFIVMGGARRDLGDTDAARVLLQKAVRAAKSPMAMARSRFALGEMLVASGEPEDAKKWLQSAVDIDEDASWTEAAALLESLT